MSEGLLLLWIATQNQLCVHSFWDFGVEYELPTFLPAFHLDITLRGRERALSPLQIPQTRVDDALRETRRRGHHPQDTGGNYKARQDPSAMHQAADACRAKPVPLEIALVAIDHLGSRKRSPAFPNSGVIT